MTNKVGVNNVSSTRGGKIVARKGKLQKSGDEPQKTQGTPTIANKEGQSEGVDPNLKTANKEGQSEGVDPNLKTISDVVYSNIISTLQGDGENNQD